jgi:hypothetical protein
MRERKSNFFAQTELCNSFNEKLTDFVNAKSTQKVKVTLELKS